jgi:hypothetical protein
LETQHKVNLTSSEITNLWTNIMNDSMAICIFEHYLATVEDTEIHSVIEYAMSLSKKHVQTITSIFNEEKIAVPRGFTKEDVNSNAPRLFPDTFYLMYVHNQAKFGLNAYSVALSNAARADIRKFYSELLASSTQLYNQSSEVLLEKGLFLRSPGIPMPQTVEFVKKQSFLTGWFGDRRPLNGIEIAHIFFNLVRNLTGSALTLGLSQTAKSSQIQKYMNRGHNISRKHVEIFQSLLAEDNLPAPNNWDAVPTDSTIPPFSDKLMMFHIAGLNGAGIGYYGASLGVSSRRDLGAHYSRLTTEVIQFAEDGVNIMIDNGWLEKPPQAPDRQALVEGKK